jgi:hypothetical protein
MFSLSSVLVVAVEGVPLVIEVMASEAIQHTWAFLG